MKTGKNLERSTSEKSTAPMGRNFLGHDIDTYRVSPFIFTIAQFSTFKYTDKKLSAKNCHVRENILFPNEGFAQKVKF